jgi:hypothetical protein
MIFKKLFGSGTLGGRAWRSSTEQAQGSLTAASWKAGQVVAPVVEMLGRVIKSNLAKSSVAKRPSEGGLLCDLSRDLAKLVIKCGWQEEILSVEWIDA